MEVIDKGEATEQRVDWTPVTPEVSREQLLSEIQATETPITAPVPEPAPAPAAPEPAGQTISPVQAPGQAAAATGTEVSTVPAAAPEQGQPPNPETPPALSDQQLQDFLAKKHVPPQDTWKVVKMYQEAQKALTQKSMEAAELRRQAPVSQPVVQTPQTAGVSPITGQPYQSSDPNAQLLEDLQSNPIATMKKVAELAYAPRINELTKSLDEQRLHNQVVKLSTSPETAEFNLEVVQKKIAEIMQERPDLSVNLAENLPILNDLAIGRLYREGKLNKDAVEAGKQIAEQNLATRQGAGMERGNRPVIQANKPFEAMTLAEQEVYLKKQIANAG